MHMYTIKYHLYMEGYFFWIFFCFLAFGSWLFGFWLLAFLAFGFLAFGFLAFLAFGFLAFGFLAFWLFWLFWLFGFWLLAFALLTAGYSCCGFVLAIWPLASVGFWLFVGFSAFLKMGVKKNQDFQETNVYEPNFATFFLWFQFYQFDAPLMARAIFWILAFGFLAFGFCWLFGFWLLWLLAF